MRWKSFPLLPFLAGKVLYRDKRRATWWFIHLALSSFNFIYELIEGIICIWLFFIEKRLPSLERAGTLIWTDGLCSLLSLLRETLIGIFQLPYECQRFLLVTAVLCQTLLRFMNILWRSLFGSVLFLPTISSAKKLLL